MLRKIVLCGSLLLSAGCQKKAAVILRPLIMPTLAPTPVATIQEPESVPDTAPAPIESTIAINPDPLPAPPTPAPSRPNPRPPSRPVAVAPEPVAPTPVPAPSLGAILSADERKKLDAEYQADLREANKALNSVRGRALNPNQAETVDRASAFITQAAQYHDRDLATAAELARRARVLTQDLAGAH
jgi:hypothetical protein